MHTKLCISLAAALCLSLTAVGCSKDRKGNDDSRSIDSAEASLMIQEALDSQKKAESQSREMDIRSQTIRSLQAETEADVSGFDQGHLRALFYSEPIGIEMAQRIEGDMLDTQAGYITPEQLRLVRVLYSDFEGRTKVGELICNELISEDLENVFYELYMNAYPIDRIVLPYGYGMDDESVTADDITRCLATVWDENGQAFANEHSLGLAVDFNSLYNPQVITEGGQDLCLPEAGRPYADRTTGNPHYISEDDLAYQIFTKYGFNWGGVWQGRNDYQHFEKFFNHDTQTVDTSVYAGS